VALSPKSVAIIGASETTLWTYWAMRNLSEYGHEGDLWLVNPNRPEVYGTKTFPSVADLPGIPDTAILITSPTRSITAAQELVDAGVKELICISDGFRETATEEGRALEEQLKSIVAGKGVRLIGPNCVGYASLHDNFGAIAEPIPLGIKPGAVSVLSQSGVLTHTALAALKAEGLGVDQIYSLGNSAAFTFADAVDYLVERPTTEVICAVIESITDVAALERAVVAGREKGKRFIWLLLGQSEDGKRVAASHTGAVIGDQRIMRAWLEELGVILVTSFDELTRTAALSLQVGRPSARKGVFFLASSGGASGIAADTAAAYGLPLAQITDKTAAILRANILPGTTVGNPLDITTHGGPQAVKNVWEAIAQDPNVGLMIEPVGLSWPDDTDSRRWHRAGMLAPVEVSARVGTPLVYSSLMEQPMTDFVQRIIDENPQISVNTGFAVTVSSLARLYDHTGESPKKVSHNNQADPASIVDEAAARRILADLGFPVVQGIVADSAASAGEKATTIAAPWVAKVAVEGLSHKGRVGGVRLGITTVDQLVEACEDITAKVVEFGIAPAEEVGFMVQEMVFGPEILVGLVRDGVAGPAAVVGVGGWAAESASIFATIPLPATAEHISDLVLGSALPRLIGESKAAELTRLLADLTTQFTEGALAEYDTVELNPVIMAEGGPKIADALLVRPSATTDSEVRS
jgi:acyl-CoA synthetase (NDP forming)